MNLPSHVSESVRKLNPSIYGPDLGSLSHPVRQSDQWRQSQDCQLDKSTSGMGYRVTIISVRKRLVDAHDNIRIGCKPLIDAITASLGFASDDNPRLHWEYSQVIGTSEGTIVRIDALKP